MARVKGEIIINRPQAVARIGVSAAGKAGTPRMMSDRASRIAKGAAKRGASAAGKGAAAVGRDAAKLAGEAAKAGYDAATIERCPHCGEPSEGRDSVCPHCGHEKH
jgi:rubrerythrin